MKKFIPWIIVAAVVAVLGFWGVGCYNEMVTQEENVETAWGDVQTYYQRRADLIPNLVNTVKGYAQHESATLQNVIEARAKATQITIDPANATPEQLAQYQEAQGQLSQALGRLMAVAEAYPDLKANTNFRDLQAQLEGTENRIAVARQNYNEAVKTFNTYVRRFPKNIVAAMCGFEKKAYFEADATAAQAPEVQF
ncbi:MAG: LemA family protein [Bacteroidales bacterium]|nr:LemA family protein [Bacteroidales bacterium]